MYLLTESPLRHAVLPAILAIVFIETGLLFPLLPGDSLLFTGGLLAHQPHPPVSIWTLLILVPLTAILGDQVAYWIGRKLGPTLFSKKDSKFFKQEYVTESHAFFEKHGPKTIILARFVPIVRTFAPVVAGISKMKYTTFLAFDIVGGILWGGGVTLLGYYLGGHEFIQKNIEAIFILIVLISVLPGIIGITKKYLAARRGGATPGQAVDEVAKSDLPDAGARHAAPAADQDPVA
ncbi:DedA family protein [Rhodococcus sp. D2-41]|uniref:VTT domain-containing protein n=1 Tax=Speluncibacter jeojiensis TaxID=2710754 RepID=A0A9X4RE93_9ACTN|nr:VTT domain-containing protein [Rhodococcus sp. D2-41]MDG3010104.1 DedA family protein [Rhodococcus sp. D2-41]MDG3015650.1 VTT domain-containing protein [Corynebacteriales bacterium D3-21]